MLEMLQSVLVALVLAVLPSFLGFALFLSPAGYSPMALVALYTQMGGLGVLVLGVLVFWRLYTGARRPSWIFIFFFAGAINIIVWSILTAVGSMAPEGSIADPYLDLTQSYAIIALIVAFIWAIAGSVFGSLQSRPSADSRRQ